MGDDVTVAIATLDAASSSWPEEQRAAWRVARRELRLRKYPSQTDNVSAKEHAARAQAILAGSGGGDGERKP